MMVGLFLRPSKRSRGRVLPIADDLLAYQAVDGICPGRLEALYAISPLPSTYQLVGGLRRSMNTVACCRRRIARYVELFQLDTHRYSPMSSFSKGMRQKVYSWPQRCCMTPRYWCSTNRTPASM